MFDKEEFLAFALFKFTRFGSKRFTLDDLAHEMGISKKTIYEHFTSKEEILQESLYALLNKLRKLYKQCIEEHKSDPILAIIEIYKIGFDSYRTFSPSFIFGLKKYYPSVYDTLSKFRNIEANILIKNLLQSAIDKGQIRSGTNIELICELYLNRLELILFSSKNLYEQYSATELVEHIIVNNLRGIATEDYLKKTNFLLQIS
ncbi:TetR/AcrR family transcriptional regulator [Aurantibacter crassamenti]|uniref:TetR/AcrR family transcriptional regulator n=1 Tax=Aurantibacter crassamenti TaxID=1837375 RepID=UPI00193AA528|nr:TetR/AcrR family transcriptional regulator [Aurantibacter crassamenti]MBM1104972.1 TetR/AcrR family transcriptional regulator [Aurantibacter crassamenti]